MHVRIHTVRRGHKVYRYTQLVHSYRNSKGTPVHKVLASLGDLPQVAVDNLKAALAASRRGEAVVAPAHLPGTLDKVSVVANLAWLDVAVMHAVGRDVGLWDLLADAGSPPDTPSQWAEVVEALVVHRCVAPNSELAATRWYPNTALPELLGVSGEAFNNTRVHRALAALEQNGDAVQERLAPLLQRRVGAFSVLFGDITQVAFEGRGPELASMRRCRDGASRRLVGVMLLCDGRGLPLRWQTLAGDYSDTGQLQGMARQVTGLSWARQVPIVMDRAVGSASALDTLLETGLPFVTAVPAGEFDSYGIPATPGDANQANEPEDFEALGRAAAKAGFEYARSDRFVRDLGIVERTRTGRLSHAEGANARLMAVARKAQQLLDSGAMTTRKQLAARLGGSTGSIGRCLKLLELSDEIQQRVERGDAESLSLSELVHVARCPGDRQQDEFDTALKRRRERGARRGGRPRAIARDVDLTPIRVRGVLYFSPSRFVEARRVAEARHRDLVNFVDRLNERLRSPNSRRDDTSIRAAVLGRLRHLGVTRLYRVRVEAGEHRGRTRWQVRLERDPDEWERRRRHHGLYLIVSSPDLVRPAAELVDMYYAKDQVEKDFQTIKSEIEIHPVRHRKDDKVKAHVDVCMLALVIRRVLEHRLAGAGLEMSASAAIEALSTCHLNQVRAPWGDYYTVTQLTDTQSQILEALGLEKLATPAIATSLRPR